METDKRFQETVQEKLLAKRKEKQKNFTQPRYDEVFFRGTQWLDDMAFDTLDPLSERLISVKIPQGILSVENLSGLLRAFHRKDWDKLVKILRTIVYYLREEQDYNGIRRLCEALEEISQSIGRDLEEEALYVPDK